MISIGKKTGFVDKTGKAILQHINIQGISADSKGFSDGLAVCNIGKGFGYIGPDGSMKISGPFEKADDFIDGFAIVVLPGQNHPVVIDKTGNVIIRGTYKHITWHPRAGIFLGFSDYGADVTVTALNTNGSPIWVNQ